MKFLLSEHYVGTLYLAAGSLPYMSTCMHRTDSKDFVFFSPVDTPNPACSSTHCGDHLLFTSIHTYFFFSPSLSPSFLNTLEHIFFGSHSFLLLFFFFSLRKKFDRAPIITMNRREPLSSTLVLLLLLLIIIYSHFFLYTIIINNNNFINTSLYRIKIEE